MDWDQTLVLGVALSCTVMSGCAATLETHRVDAATWKLSKESLPGVVYYEPRLLRITYTYHAFTSDAAPTTTKCERAIQKEEIQAWPNFDRPMLLGQKPGILSNNTFAVGLSNGMLTSANSVSSTAVPEILGTVAKLAETGGALLMTLNAPQGVVPRCNADPRLSATVLKIG